MKILGYLHSGVTLQTVQGPAKFDKLGENHEAVAFAFQWQNGNFVQVLGGQSEFRPDPVSEGAVV